MIVAYWRALADLGLTRVPDFSDPAAAKLLDGPLWRLMLKGAGALAREPQSVLARRMRPYVDGLVLRVAFIDAVIQASGVRQVVILGAGLDTRAWRLPALRGARVFEVDHPATQAYKRAHVARLGPPLAEVSFVPVDFTRDDLASALAGAGHDLRAPSLWVWEGVIMYLDDAALRSTLSTVRRLSPPGSELIAHYHEREASASAVLFRTLLLSSLGEPQLGIRAQQVMRAEIERSGFRLIEDAGLAEQAARVGATAPANSSLDISRVLVAA
jgi:methyltransferase (TIGR00027 family)